MPEETPPHLLLGARDQRLDAGQKQLPYGSTGTSSGNCQETKTGMVWACHMPQQPLQNLEGERLGGRVAPWSAEEMLNGQRKRVDIHAHARTCLLYTSDAADE